MAALTSNFDECHKQIMTLLPEMKTTGKATPDQCEELEKQFEQLILLVQTEEVEEDEMEDLAEILQEVKEYFSCVLNEQEDLLQTVKELKVEIQSQKDNLKSLEEKYQILEKKIDSFRSGLIAGQLINCFEKEAAKKILEGTGESEEDATLSEIDELLQGRESYYLPEILQTQEQKETVKENWRRFNTDHGFSKKDYRHMYKLRRQRNETAHPHMGIKEAQEQFQKMTMNTEKDRRICMEVLKAMEKLGIATI